MFLARGTSPPLVRHYSGSNVQLLCFVSGDLAHSRARVTFQGLDSSSKSKRGRGKLRMLIALEETDSVYAVRVLHSNMNMLHGWLHQKPVMPAHVTKIIQQHKRIHGGNWRSNSKDPCLQGLHCDATPCLQHESCSGFRPWVETWTKAPEQEQDAIWLFLHFKHRGPMITEHLVGSSPVHILPPCSRHHHRCDDDDRRGLSLSVGRCTGESVVCIPHPSWTLYYKFGWLEKGCQMTRQMISKGPFLRWEPLEAAKHQARGHLYTWEKPVCFRRCQYLNPVPTTYEANSLP